jgi:hypothetical protein
MLWAKLRTFNSYVIDSEKFHPCNVHAVNVFVQIWEPTIMKIPQIKVTDGFMSAGSGDAWRAIPYADATNVPFLASIGYHILIQLHLPYAATLCVLYRGTDKPLTFPL